MKTIKNFNQMTLSALESHFEDLKNEAKAVKAAISFKKAELTLSNAEFVAAWTEAMSLFTPLVSSWKSSAKDNEEYNSLTLKEKAALLAAGFKPGKEVKLEYILVRSNPGQVIVGWEDAAKVLLSQLIEADPVLEPLGLYVRMAVKKVEKPAEMPKQAPAVRTRATDRTYGPRRRNGGR